MLPPTIFFFIALHLVAFIRILMLKGTGIPFGTSVSVTVAALVLGKSVVIADLLPIINRFPEKPLAYNVVWKTTTLRSGSHVRPLPGASRRLLARGRQFRRR